jgi:hypothetical protein
VTFDPTLLPETCSACQQRVVKVDARCPLCASKAEQARASTRPAVVPLRVPAAERLPGAGQARYGHRTQRLLERSTQVAWLDSPQVEPGEPIASLELSVSEVWAAAVDLARVDAAVRAAGLALELRAEDVRFDRVSGHASVLELERLDDGLGWDPRRGAVAWGELVADLLRAPRGPGGVELEAVSDRHPPALLAAVRATLGGAPPFEALAQALELEPDASRAADLRAEVARDVLAQVLPEGPPRPILVARELVSPVAGARAFLALDVVHDRPVRLEAPLHAPGDDPAAILARRQAFVAQGDPVLLAPPLDPALATARVPALRRGEPFRLHRLDVEPGTTEVVVAPPPPPALTVAVRPDGAAALTATGLAPGAQAAFVRARAGAGVLLVPEDGDLVGTAEAGPDGAAALDDATPGERYAVFPLERGKALPPGRASTVEATEVEALTATPAIGAIEVRWHAPEHTTVVVRHKATPITGPGDGELLYWGRAQEPILQDCLDPDQQVHYRAFALGQRGTFSPGVEATAVALGPPPALGTVRATPGDQRVTLAWTWPEGRSYDRALVRREPGWPEGERVVLRDADACLVDEGAPLGVALTYELRAALGTTAGRRESKVTSKALAELSAFRALPGGRSVVLELGLPSPLPHGAHAEVVRNTDHVPHAMDDGSFVRLARGATRHVDEPLPAGSPVHYRACLVLDGARSPGLVASATPLERAGQLSGVQATAGRGCLEVRFTPPTERCEEVRLLAGPASGEGELTPVACDAAALQAGGPVRVEATPGAAWKVRLVPVYQGNADAAQAVDVTATAWDDASGLTSRPAPSAVELRWTPPAAPPRAYRLKRAPKGKDDEAVELAVPADASRFVDTDVVARRTYVYLLTSRWGAEGQEVETPPQQVEATVWASPPDLERPEVRSLAGGVQVSWLPCPAKERVHWDGVAVFTSERPEDEVRAALADLLFTTDEAAGLGLTLVEARKKARAKETLRLAPPAEGTTRTYVLASQSGPMHRAVRVEAAVGLPDGFLTLRPDPAAGQPTLAWELPGWLRTGRARLKKLAITRGLEDASVEGLEPTELAELSQPWRADLDPGATTFVDHDVLAFVTWGYSLEATLDVGGQEVVVPGPRVVVPRCQGGKLMPAAEQARGFFGFSAKSEVKVTFAIEGGRTTAWPPFELTRGVAGQAGAKVVWSCDGGAAPPPFTDTDLSNFTKGMTLVYATKLKRARDGLGFSVGESRVTLG